MSVATSLLPGFARSIVPFKTLIAMALVALSAVVNAAAPEGADADAVNKIVAETNPPAGIVFEIVSGNRDELITSLPRVRTFAEALRKAHPSVPVAVVTHGSEQFALMSEQEPRYSEVHSIVKELRDDVSIDVEVCGNHARMRGVAPDAFPDYVQVAVGASVAINEYVEKGYVLILVD